MRLHAYRELRQMENTKKNTYFIISFYSTERNLFFFEYFDFFESLPLTGAEHHKKVSKSYSLVRRAIIRIKYEIKMYIHNFLNLISLIQLVF